MRSALPQLAPALAPWLLCAACSAPAGPGGAPQAPSPVRLAQMERVEPEFLPALEALQTAVLDEEEEVARAVLAQLMARRPRGTALELALGFERILDGRALARDLSLELVAHERLDAPGVYELTLVAHHPRQEPVVYRPAAGSLRESVVAVDADGSEHRGVWSSAAPAALELVLPPGEVVCRRLAELVAPPAPGALAARQRVTLELLAGQLELGGRVLPAREREVGPAEVVRLARFLPTATVAPEELARYASEERIYPPALMERAVRIDPARRDEALDLLSPLAAGLSLPRMEALVPALRWLAGTLVPGGDPEAWRAWLVARGGRAEDEEP